MDSRILGLPRTSSEHLFLGDRAEDIAASLRRAAAAGAIIVGDTGSGKTTLAQHALRALGGDAYIVRIRGSAAMAAIPYGAINFLLSEADAPDLDHPLQVLHTVAHVLQDKAAGRSVVLFVDNAQSLDRMAAAMLAQLVAMGRALLLTCCEDISALPGGLDRLWQDGLLERFDMPGLGIRETAAWLAAALAGEGSAGDSPAKEVSTAAAHALWAASGGNPLLLKVLCAEWSDSGRLAEAGGTWVLTRRPAVRGAGLAAVLPPALADVGGGQRLLAEVLAFTGALPVAPLLRLGPAEDLDALLLRGLVRLVPGARPAAHFPSRLLREVVRRAVPPERSRELLAAVGAAGGWELLAGDAAGGGADTLLGTAGTALAAWSLECGAGLGPQHALAAARLANRSHDAAAALAFLAAAPQVGSPAATAEGCRAALALGDHAAARRMLADYDAETGADGCGGAESVDLAIVRSEVLRAEDRTAPDTANVLIRARWRLGCVSRGAAGCAGPGAERLDVAEAALAVYQGRYREVDTAALLPLLHSGEPDLRDRARAVVFETWAAMGREADAVRLAVELLGLPGLADGAPGHPGVVYPSFGQGGLEPAFIRIFSSLSVHRLWDGCGLLLAGPRVLAGVLANPDLLPLVEVAAALADAESNHPARALRRLQPVLNQLRSHDSRSLRRVAAAAAAYAHALLGERAAAAELLREAAPDPRFRPAWRADVLASYYAAMASAAVSSVPAAVDRLLGKAQAAHDGGAAADELLFRSGAVRLGDAGSVAGLAKLAAGLQGPAARLWESYAAAVAERDGGGLLAAADLAAAQGNGLLAREAARLALTAAGRTGDAAVMRAAQKHLHAHCENFDFALGAHGSRPGLTPREREIGALAAAGASNGAIADRLNLSVRTVEGYLHRIYRKLQLEDRRIFAGSAAGCH